jgi:hypothetical protein
MTALDLGAAACGDATDETACRTVTGDCTLECGDDCAPECMAVDGRCDIDCGDGCSL